MWKDYYEPQIAARNRWVEHAAATAAPAGSSTAARPLRRPSPTAARRFALAGVAAGIVAAVAGLGPLSGSPTPTAGTEVVAPAPAAPLVPQLPAQHQLGSGRALAE